MDFDVKILLIFVIVLSNVSGQLNRFEGIEISSGKNVMTLQDASKVGPSLWRCYNYDHGQGRNSLQNVALKHSERFMGHDETHNHNQQRKRQSHHKRRHHHIETRSENESKDVQKEFALKLTKYKYELEKDLDNFFYKELAAVINEPSTTNSTIDDLMSTFEKNLLEIAKQFIGVIEEKYGLNNSTNGQNFTENAEASTVSSNEDNMSTTEENSVSMLNTEDTTGSMSTITDASGTMTSVESELSSAEITTVSVLNVTEVENANHTHPDGSIHASEGDESKNQTASDKPKENNTTPINSNNNSTQTEKNNGTEPAGVSIETTILPNLENTSVLNGTTVTVTETSGNLTLVDASINSTELSLNVKEGEEDNSNSIAQNSESRPFQITLPNITNPVKVLGSNNTVDVKVDV